MGTACEASNGLGLVLRPLLCFDQLAVAGSALERREARRMKDALPSTARELAAAPWGREGGGGAGGQAANVAAWASSLGASARCIAKRGADATGELVARELAGHGVELVGPVADGSTGVVVSFVGGDGERSMASDRGVAPTLAPEE